MSKFIENNTEAELVLESTNSYDGSGKNEWDSCPDILWYNLCYTWE